MRKTTYINKSRGGGINWLDVIRVVALLMVLTVHVGQRVLPIDSNIRFYTNFGDRAVPVFFALSGFLIMHSLQSVSQIKFFYLKRFFRIIPLYYTILIILMCFRDMPADELGLGWWRYFLFMNEIVPAEHNEWISICGF